MTARAFAYRPRALPELRFRSGPFTGMNDARQPNADTSGVASLLENCYPDDTEFGPRVRGRPGFALMGAQLGASSKRTGQRIVQLTKRDGTEYTAAIVGGQGIATYNWGTDTWTTVVSVANLTTASITLSETARVYCVTFNDKLVVSDGVNTPWTWDGTSGAGGLASLTNAPVLYGQPVVYYAKLFGIKNTARQTIVWSEEGDPATGYEAGGYNNAWDLIQTATEGLVALAATDEALYYFRQNSTGAILGAVTTDFQTSGTLPGVDPSIGTRSPAGVLVSGNQVVFPDQFGQFQSVRVGQGATPVGLGIRNTMSLLVAAELANILAVDDVEAGLVRFWVPESGESAPSMMVNLLRDSLTVAGVDRGYKGQAVGIVKDSTGVPTMVHIGGSAAATAGDGYAYVHGRQSGSTWNDGFQAASQPIAHQVVTGRLGFDTDTDKTWERFDLSVMLATALTGLSIILETPRGTGSSVALATQSAGGGLWDVMLWDTGLWGGAGGERHMRFTSRRTGRWCQVKLNHSTASERFELIGLTALARPVDTRPQIY